METNSIEKFFTINKSLKIDFQNFHILLTISKKYIMKISRYETVIKYVFHEMLLKNYFTVYSRL